MKEKEHIWMVQKEYTAYNKKLWVDVRWFYTRKDARFWKKESNLRIKKVYI